MENKCEHPIDKRASFKSHGKDFCWKCGNHIEEKDEVESN